MRINLHLATFLMIGWTALYAQDKPDQGFVLVKQDGPVSIYERWIIFPDSDPPQEAREVKGEFTVRTNPFKILHLLRDESRIRVWQPHVSKFKVYLQPDTTFWLEYSYHDIPWPVSDQDHFLEYQLYERKPGDLFITFKSRKDPVLAPRQRNVTRMILSGSWHLESLPDHRVKITYRILSMPVGIPRLFTDPIIRNKLMETIEELMKLSEQ